MNTTATITVGLCLAVVAGCAPTSGVVTSVAAPQIGEAAPDIKYVSADGRETALSTARHDLAVIAFVESPGGTCCWLSPQAVRLADDLWDLPVSVVQVLVPLGKCPHGRSCIEGCNLRKSGLMSICDGTWDAWAAYGRPEDGTLFLIDEQGKILMTGSFSKPAPLVERARRLGEEQRERFDDKGRRDIY